MSDSTSYSADYSLGGSTAHRPTLVGTDHMVVAGHYGAAHAAFIILEGGGNAVDAGVAAGLALGVLQCDIVQFAGVAPIILREAKSGQVHTIAGLGPWPKLTNPERLRREFDGHIPEGLLRTVVPAAPDAWITALERFGTMSFGDVAQAAIRFAKGFPMYPLLADMIGLHKDEYRRWAANAEIYLPGGRPPIAGEMFRQTDLARTLQYMVDEEAANGRHTGARSAFYKGDIARTITTYHEKNGGWLRMDDLADYSSEVAPAITRVWNGIEISTCGPWCQGPVLQHALGLLDPRQLQSMGHNTAEYVHYLSESLKIALLDREKYYGDPRFVDVPIDVILSQPYLDRQKALINPRRARYDEDVTEAVPQVPRDTSYVCVIDRYGNVFSATPSDVSFDSEVIPGTGLVPSSRGCQSWCDPAHKSVLAPGKRPRLTPNPALAIKPGEWMMPIGSPGGDVQCQAMLQVFLNYAVFGMPPQEAVEAPRFATYSFPDSFEPHHAFPGRLNVETRISANVIDDLRSRHHDLVEWPDWTWRAGAVCTAIADLRTGVLSGGADPRRPSYAMGW